MLQDSLHTSSASENGDNGKIIQLLTPKWSDGVTKRETGWHKHSCQLALAKKLFPNKEKDHETFIWVKAPASRVT